MTESTCKVCGKPIVKDSDSNLKNTKWVHKSSLGQQPKASTRGAEIWDQDHNARPGAHAG